MREIGTDTRASKERVKKLIGIPLLLKIDEGRGKNKIYHGTIVNVFPAVFSVKLENGTIKTFSYSDVHTKGIMFLKDEE